jgi:hypothetical protein
MDGIPPIIPALQSAYDFEREVERELAGEGHKGNGADKAQCSARFKLEDWNDVDFDPNEEWRVEDVLPMRGFGLIYGKPRSFKSFVAMDLAIRVVLGRAHGQASALQRAESSISPQRARMECASASRRER